MFPSGLPSTAPPVPKWSLQWESGANPCGPAMKWESGANPCGAAMQCTAMGTLNLGSNTLKPQKSSNFKKILKKRCVVVFGRRPV